MSVSPALLRLLLKLAAAHLLGDFVLQPESWAGQKRRASLLLRHLAVHAGLLLLVALSEPTSPALWVGLALVLASHAGIDAWSSRREGAGLGTLATDQALHLLVLGIVVVVLRGAGIGAGGGGLARWLADWRPYLLVSGVILVAPAGAVAIGRWVQPFREALSEESRDQRAGLERAGRWIGMLERLLVFAAILFRLESLVGFVIAVKAVLRLPEAREKWSRELAEYYVVGTLASLAWALAVALAVRWAVQGRM